MLRSFGCTTSISLRSIVTSSIISLITTILLFTLFQSSFFNTYELKSLDFFQKLNAPIVDPQVVMVEIDQKSLTVLSKQGIHWPWPRQVYVPVIETCAEARARGIIFDIIFSEPSSYGVEDDLEFAQGIDKAQRVFLPMSMSVSDEYETDILPIQRFGLRDDAPQLLFKRAQSYVPPIEELAAVVEGLGDVIVAPDSDGIYRRVALFTRYHGYLFPALAASPLRDRFGFQGRNILFDGKVLAVTNSGELLLHYYGKAFQFPRLNILELIAAYQNREDPLFNTLSKQIEDRFIIVALTAPGLLDLKPTAVTSRSPGAYVHGTLLANLIRGDHIRQVEAVWKFFLIFLLGTVLGLFVFTILSFWKNSLILLLFTMGWPAVSLILLHYYQYWIGFLPYEIAFFIIFGMTATYSYSMEGKKRRMIRRLFSQYMTEILVQELEAHPEKARLGGEKRFITLFFSDLADFTRLSEQLAPEKIVGLLNDYFTEMSQIILDSKGIIDKYQGDGIMAFWGAPIFLQDHAVRACLAAMRCQRSMEKINHKLENDKLPPLSMRIGLHSGEAIVGNMGSTQRFDYTAIGDSVNLASRLEGLNKQFGTTVMISEATYQLAKERVEARELDLIAVKGKEKPIRVFQLLGEKDKISESDERIKMRFEDGLRLYRMKKFEEAQRMFEKAAEIEPRDGASRAFIARCKSLKDNPPPVDWDGVMRLKDK